GRPPGRRRPAHPPTSPPTGRQPMLPSTREDRIPLARSCPPLWSFPTRSQGIDQPEELLQVEGLRQVAERARRQQSFGRLLASVGAQDGNRNRARRRVAAQPPERLLAVEIREPHVEEDQVGALAACELEPGAGVHGGQ